MRPAASQTTYLLTLQDRHQAAEHNMALQIEKPDGFTFMAGQSIDLTLMHPSETDGEGNGRTFSIASAPDEDLFLVATRMRETAFKRVLDQARTGVFLAGGIGITPFRSILLRVAREPLPPRLFLFY